MTSQTFTSKQNKTYSPVFLSNESYRCVVYLIELSDDVMNDAAFARKNPKWKDGMPCYYVGMTSLDPRERFEQHRVGHRNASRIAHRFGKELRMDLVSQTKRTRAEYAVKKESRLVDQLRARGCGAWNG